MSPGNWDVGEPLALASDIPNLGFDLDQYAPSNVNWSLDSTTIVQAAIDAASAAGGGEVVVRNEGRTYLWLGVQMASNVGLRFLGTPTVRKAGGATSTHIIEHLGAEGDVASTLASDHPLATPYDVDLDDAAGFAAGDVVAVMDDTYVYALSPVASITSGSWSAGVATLGFGASPQTAAGDAITISGATPSGYDGTFMTLSRSGNTVTYRVADPGVWASGGTGIGIGGQTLELGKVTGVSGDTVTLDHALKRSYAVASNARMVKLDAVSDSYLVGPARFELTDGTAGGGILWRYAYNCRAHDIDVYGANDDPAFYATRSARIRIRDWGAYDGQNVSVGGEGYGVQIAGSSHDVRVTEGSCERIRENNASDGAMDVVFENNSAMWTYDDAFNTHGAGCRRVRIANNNIGFSRSAGVTVAFGSSHAADNDVDVIGNDIYDCGGSGIAVKGNDDGTKNPQNIRVRGNRVLRPLGSYGILLQRSDHCEVEGNTVEGGGVSGQIGILAAHAEDVDVTGNRLSGSGSDYGLKWDTLTGHIANNRVRDFASHNLWGLSSTVTLGPNVMDDADVSLEGTETLVGSDSLAGPASTSYSDTNITPDPTYRRHVWSPTTSKTINAPTATKRAVGQKITFDITNAGVVSITPVWDSAFKLSSPFVVAAP